LTFLMYMIWRIAQQSQRVNKYIYLWVTTLAVRSVGYNNFR